MAFNPISPSFEDTVYRYGLIAGNVIGITQRNKAKQRADYGKGWREITRRGLLELGFYAGTALDSCHRYRCGSVPITHARACSLRNERGIRTGNDRANVMIPIEHVL
jgi:hypothetical protein